MNHSLRTHFAASDGLSSIHRFDSMTTSFSDTHVLKSEALGRRAHPHVSLGCYFGRTYPGDECLSVASCDHVYRFDMDGTMRGGGRFSLGSTVSLLIASRAAQSKRHEAHRHIALVRINRNALENCHLGHLDAPARKCHRGGRLSVLGHCRA